jgi:hypothetical protein
MKPRAARWMLAIAVIAAAASLAIRSGSVPTTAPPSAASPHTGLAAIPLGARAAVGAKLGSVEPAYWFHGLRAANPAQRLQLGFSSHGVRVVSGHGVLGLSLVAFGRSGAESAVAPAAPRVIGSHVVYDRGILREWYTNSPLGLEQGFDVAKAPAGASGGLLMFSIAVSGDLRPSASGRTVRFAGAGASLSYGGLIAVDATGRRLPASIAVRGGRVILSVDARAARYPLRVDPTIAQATPTALLDTPTSSHFGDDQLKYQSVAISGSTLVVGAPGMNDGTGASPGAEQGAVFVYQEPAGGWASTSAPTATLTASDGVAFDAFGDSVAISGGTIVASAPYHAIPHGQGTVYVFTGSGGNWTQTAELSQTTPMGEVSGPIGTNGTLATSGNTVVVGTEDDAVGQNQDLLVYDEPGGGWVNSVTPTAELGAPGSFVSSGLGVDGLAMTANTIVAGDASGNSGKGAAYVYVNGGAGFPTTPTAVLTASDAASGNALGASVAISGDGNTIVAGDPSGRSGTANGSVYVYTKPGGGWANGTDSAELTVPPTNTGTNDLAGTSVAIAGGTVVAGAPDAPGDSGFNDENGGVFVFNEPAGGWANSSAPDGELVEAGQVSSSLLGTAVAMSGTAVFGTAPQQFLHGFPATFAWGGPFTAHTLTVDKAGTGTGSVGSTGPGGIGCGTTCSAAFLSGGGPVTLTERPANGTTFTGWSGGGCSGAATTCLVTMSSDQTVTATFSSGSGGGGGGGGGGGTPPPPAPGCTIHPNSSKVRVKGKQKSKIGLVTLTATCTENAAVTVRAKVTMQGKKPRHGKAKTHTLSLATVHGSASANVALTLTVKLPASAVSGLKSGDMESVLFTLQATNANGTGTATATIPRLHGT